MQQQNLLSDDSIVEIVEKDLPKWKEACLNTDTPVVIFNQGAFSTSDADLFLLAVAIKYAGIVKKNVTIAA